MPLEDLSSQADFYKNQAAHLAALLVEVKESNILKHPKNINKFPPKLLINLEKEISHAYKSTRIQNTDLIINPILVNEHDTSFIPSIRTSNPVKFSRYQLGSNSSNNNNNHGLVVKSETLSLDTFHTTCTLESKLTSVNTSAQTTKYNTNNGNSLESFSEMQLINNTIINSKSSKSLNLKNNIKNVGPLGVSGNHQTHMYNHKSRTNSLTNYLMKKAQKDSSKYVTSSDYDLEKCEFFKRKCVNMVEILNKIREVGLLSEHWSSKFEEVNTEIKGSLSWRRQMNVG